MSVDNNILVLSPRKLSGLLQIQPSKSAGHRMMICAALAKGSSRIENPGVSQDIQATAGALRALSLASFEQRGNELLVNGFGGESQAQPESVRVADCGESGSTLRFLLPLALDGIETVFTGSGRLLERPMTLYETLFKERGIRYEQTKNGIVVKGRLESGVYRCRGDISSQFISGLLFALPLAAGNSRIELSTPLESRGYVELTIEAMSMFGVTAHWEGENAIVIPGGQTYTPANVRVEGDYSHAAFFLVAGAIGGGIGCSGLKNDTLQGDRAILDVLRSMGAKIEESNGVITAHPSQLHGAVIDAAQIPDLVPVLAVAACAAQGETRIINAARLRIKESDRLSAMAKELCALGGAVSELSDGLIIRGTGRLCGGRVDSHNDHRVAMSLAVASSICTSDVILSGYASVKKSAPDFFDEFKVCGGAFS